MTSPVTECPSTGALVRERLEHALRRYGELADEVSAMSDDPFALFERHPRLADLHADATQAAGLLGLALIRHVTAGGDFVLDDEPVAPAADNPKATHADIEAFTRGFARGAEAPALVASPAPHVQLQGYLERLGAPSAITTDAAFIEAVENMEALTGDQERDLWTHLPDGVHVMLLQCLVAWVRGLQQWPSPIIPGARVDELFRLLADHRRSARPGYVYGLGRYDLPRGQNWFEDAEECLDTLLEYAFEPHPILRRSAPAGARSPSTGRKDEVIDQVATVIEPEVVSRTRGIRAAIVGGSARPQRRDEIARALQLEELDWVETEHPSAVDRLVERIRGGTVGLVIALRFRAHSHAGKVADACSTAKVPLAQSYGYGVRAVVTAVSHAFG